MERYPLHSWKMEHLNLISRDHNQPILKRLEFSEVLYNSFYEQCMYL